MLIFHERVLNDENKHGTRGNAGANDANVHSWRKGVLTQLAAGSVGVSKQRFINCRNSYRPFPGEAKFRAPCYKRPAGVTE